jgi:hypothetical protein
LAEILLLDEEEIIFKSRKPIELQNNSNRPEKINLTLGRYWVVLTNFRIVFYSESNPMISEKIEDVDYYSLFKKEGHFEKYRLRLWIGLTRLDLISEKENLEEIFVECKKRITLKLKKGASVIMAINGEETPIYKAMLDLAKSQNIEMIDLLREGKISLTFQNMKHNSQVENEDNWNLLDNSDGSMKVILIPAFDYGKDVVIPEVYTLRFIVRPPLTKKDQEITQQVIMQGNLNQDFKKISVNFTEGYEDKVMADGIKGKPMLIEIIATYPTIGYSKNLKDQIMSYLHKKNADEIPTTIRGRTSTDYEIKLKQSTVDYKFVFKNDCKIIIDKIVS